MEYYQIIVICTCDTETIMTQLPTIQLCYENIYMNNFQLLLLMITLYIDVTDNPLVYDELLKASKTSTTSTNQNPSLVYFISNKHNVNKPVEDEIVI